MCVCVFHCDYSKSTVTTIAVMKGTSNGAWKGGVTLLACPSPTASVLFLKTHGRTLDWTQNCAGFSYHCQHNREIVVICEYYNFTEQEEQEIDSGFLLERLKWLLCNICCTLSSIFVFHIFPWTLEAETNVWYEAEWIYRIMYIELSRQEDCFHMHLLECAHFLCVQWKSNLKMPAWRTWAWHVTSQINSGHIYSPEQVT